MGNGSIRLAAVLLALGAGAATAQDFSGFYLGGQIGGVQSSSDYNAFTPRNSFAGFDVQGLGGSVMAGGAQVGYNWDQGSYVLGVEGSLTAFGINESSTTSDLEGNIPPFGRSLDNLMTIMPRVGFKSGNALIYAKAGLAMSSVGAWHDQNGTMLSESSTATGWAAGIGAEIPVADRLTARLDYTYADFGTVTTDLAGDPDIWTEQGVTENLFTVGINYYFH